LEITTLFVYGTLRGDPSLARHAAFLGEAVVNGTLYAFGRYTGIVVPSERRVGGELYEVVPEEWPRLIERFDEYEGDEYRRTIVDASLPSGGSVRAWVYVLAGPVENLREIVFTNPLIIRMASFLESLGIPVIPASSLLPANFPGLDIQHGCVLVDETRVVHPGDILHEAGHIAMTRPEQRNALRLTPTGGEELSTLAWSYAAATHLGLPADVIFYPESYADFGDGLVENFANGNYIGTPLLQTFGMAVTRGENAFPRMLRWLR
jgi:gamma-glutamylcyclotransferase (GGCT)/AIG2-like uncharacterized protein YtfP